jgi:hypothetical protein
MHYLHWETDRARTRSAKVIKEASAAQAPSFADIAEKLKENEQRNDRHSMEDQFSTSIPRPHASRHKNHTTAAAKPEDQHRTPLGELLFLAAQLSEAMDSQADEKLIKEYLHENPPLHPRRTLDQYVNFQAQCSASKRLLLYDAFSVSHRGN